MTRVGLTDGSLKASVPLIELGGPSSPTMSTGMYHKISWSTNYFNTADFELRSDGTIKILTTGIYKIESDVCFQIPGNHSSGTLRLRLVSDDVSIDDSMSYFTYLSHSATTYHQLNTSRVIYVVAGNLIACEFQVTNDTSIIQYGRFRITYIPISGWNNKSGGNVIDRGIRR